MSHSYVGCAKLDRWGEINTFMMAGLSTRFTFNALAVVYHGFGPIIPPDSAPAMSFGQGFVDINPLVFLVQFWSILCWLILTDACLELGPLIPAHGTSLWRLV